MTDYALAEGHIIARELRETKKSIAKLLKLSKLPKLQVRPPLNSDPLLSLAPCRGLTGLSFGFYILNP